MFPLFPLLERQFTTGWNFDDDLFLHSTLGFRNSLGI
jgi:hypothetical protein